MIKGTTAQFKFKLPKKFSEIHYIEVTFGQDGNYDNTLPIKLVYDKQYKNVTTLPSASQAVKNQIYFYNGKYYKTEDGVNYIEKISPDLIARNDGIAPEGNITSSNVIIATLEPGQTKIFSEKRKAWTQIEAYCAADNILMGSYKELFTVYPMTCTTPPPLLPVEKPTEEIVIHVDAGIIN